LPFCIKILKLEVSSLNSVTRLKTKQSTNVQNFESCHHSFAIKVLHYLAPKSNCIQRFGSSEKCTIMGERSTLKPCTKRLSMLFSMQCHPKRS
jgi:hypothetical protein